MGVTFFKTYGTEKTHFLILVVSFLVFAEDFLEVLRFKAARGWNHMAGGGWKINRCCNFPDSRGVKSSDETHWFHRIKTHRVGMGAIFPMALEAVALLFLQLLMSLVSWRRLKGAATDHLTLIDMIGHVGDILLWNWYRNISLRFPVNFIDIFWEILCIYQHLTSLFFLPDCSKLTSPAWKSHSFFFPV